jgi:2-C-methyl-D-erythritol 4-phosphate cytidylyltransferase
VTRVAVVVPAGGVGSRMGGVHKAMLPLAGTPVLARSIAPFLARADVLAVAIAVPEHIRQNAPAWLVADVRVRLVPAGAQRSDSVRNGLEAITVGVDVVLVHDGARPLVSAAIIDRCIAEAAHGRSVIAAVPVVDTIKQVDDSGRIVDTPERGLLWAAQTPQAFPAGVLRDAYARAAAEGVTATDDAALVARCGTPVMVVPGEPENIKITTPTDVMVAEALLARRGGRG